MEVCFNFINKGTSYLLDIEYYDFKAITTKINEDNIKYSGKFKRFI